MDGEPKIQIAVFSHLKINWLLVATINIYFSIN
jgi:hypothetical protein